MSLWWEGLNAFQQVIFIIAITATIVMAILLILMMVGFGAEDCAIESLNDEPIIHFSGLKIFTIRGALAFFSVGGWITYILSSSLSPFLASFFGIISGTIASILMALAFRAIYKLESDGNIDYNNAIGKIGVVYIRVPKERSGRGKVNVTVQNRYLELDAITKDLEDLLTGTQVEIVGLTNESTVIVTRK